ncbi:hypothetical protein FACS1894187_11170 [Synergistales bacterium]|nr:hypothetical protein FACS1894187_11170 [Synergistales bacterium]
MTEIEKLREIMKGKRMPLQEYPMLTEEEEREYKEWEMKHPYLPETWQDWEKIYNDPSIKKIIDPENGMEYAIIPGQNGEADFRLQTPRSIGDPNLMTDPEKEIEEIPEPEPRRMGKYSAMRRIYLEDHKKGLLASLKAEGKLEEHLLDIEEICQQKVEAWMEQMLKRNPIPEELKNTNMMEWVGRMNMTKMMAEETLQEIIYG